MSGGLVHFVVPGRLGQRTGGSIYDRRMVEGLRLRQSIVTVLELAGDFPSADARAEAELAEALAGLPDGALVVVDFLVLAGLPEVARTHASRLTLLGLVHVLPSDEPQLVPHERHRRSGLERRSLHACSGLIVTSPYTAKRLADLGIEPRRIRTVIPGTDPVPPASGPGPDAPPRILCVGAVTPGKGQDVLVRALVELAALTWSCVCAGSLTKAPAYAADLTRSIRAAGLSTRITLEGECDVATVDELYASSSIFVLPSYFESYGMALTEAMARGLPIVSTTAGAIPDTVPGDAGILVAPGDSRALAGALRSLLDDPAAGPEDEADRRRARLGAAARRHASNLPDWEGQVTVFSEALSAFGPGQAHIS